jgi:adenylate cyclase
MAQKQSDYLLGMILPRKIIDTLGKYGGNPNARDKESMHDTFVELQGVSILFADIVGFTDFSGKVNTATLISILSDIFAEFDIMASELDLEKIKTIGDCVEVLLIFLIG